jgi:hypothetical protein
VSGGEVLQHASAARPIGPGARIIAISGIPTDNERLLKVGAHVACDQNSLHFYDQVQQSAD